MLSPLENKIGWFASGEMTHGNPACSKHSRCGLQLSKGPAFFLRIAGGAPATIRNFPCPHSGVLGAFLASQISALRPSLLPPALHAPKRGRGGLATPTFKEARDAERHPSICCK